MAENEGITETQSFTERTLKYGRNVVIASVPILVFAWLEVVDLANSSPFNFEIKAGSEIWIWGILLTLLVYYGLRFFFFALPDYLHWTTKFGGERAIMEARLNQHIGAVDKYTTDIKKAAVDVDKATDKDQQEKLRSQISAAEYSRQAPQNQILETRSEIRIYNLRRTNFWLADAGLPTFLFSVALGSATSEILHLMNDHVSGG